MDKRKITIAYIMTPITFGGAEKVNLNFLKFVDKDSYQIQPILLIRPWEEETFFAHQLRSYGFRYITIPTRKAPNNDPLRVLRVAYRIYSLLRGANYDLVHSHGYFADICSLPIAKLLGIKTISTCHGFISNDRKLALYNKIDQMVLRLSNRVICVSDSLKGSLLDLGFNDEKIRIVPNAVATNQDRKKLGNIKKIIKKKMCADDDHFIVGYAGRLSEEKGLKPLMQAFCALIQKKPMCKLWLIGDGPLRSELKEMANRFRISENVMFLGFREDVTRLMAGMDVFVLPSFTEGTPMALLEAMSLGIPSIASSVGQIPKIIITGTNGCLVSPGDARELFKVILRILEDKAFAEMLSDNAIKTVKETYSIEDWVQNIESIYEELFESLR